MVASIGRRDAGAIAVLSLIGVGIPLWLTAVAGAIGLPTIDDWVYMRGATSLFLTGSIAMPGHTAATVGQVLIAQPFLWLSGGNSWAFPAYGLGMTSVAIVATYLLARRFVGAGSATMVVLLVLAFPGLAREATTFMTDVPAYALAILSLLFGVHWLDSGRRLMLVGSLAVGLLAVSIREFAIAAPAIVLMVSWARSRSEDRAGLAIVSGLFVAGLAAVILAGASVPGYTGPVAPFDIRRVALVGPAIATLALVILPATVLAMGRRIATLTPGEVIAGAFLGCLIVVLPSGPMAGNLWMPNGLAGDAFLAGTRGPVISDGAWLLTRQLALFAAILVATLAINNGRRQVAQGDSLSPVGRVILMARTKEAPLVLFLGVYAAELIAFAAVGTVIDRYLYPMVPVAALLLLGRPSQASRFGRSLAFSHAAFAWLAVSAYMILTNSLAYDTARWHEGDAAVAMGYDAQTVDAGYEWVGHHARGISKPDSGAYDLTWYERYWSSFRACAIVSNSPLDIDGLTLITVDHLAYRLYLFLGPAESLYLYGAVGGDCPSPPTVAGSSPAQRPGAGLPHGYSATAAAVLHIRKVDPL